MELVVSKFSAARNRTEDVRGREFLVASCTMLRAGQFTSGNGHRIMYPQHVLRKSAPQWDGCPVTVGHPVRASAHSAVSA